MGDIADTDARKAARPGAAQATVVAKNIQALIEGRTPVDNTPEISAATSYHIRVCAEHNIVLRSPNLDEGQTEPAILRKPANKRIWKYKKSETD